MTIYIAGPMSSLPNFNREAFCKAEARLKTLNWKVINPAKIPDIGRNFEIYWPINKAMIDGSDVIYMLDGWENSYGARKELEYAQENNVKVIFEDPEV